MDAGTLDRRVTILTRTEAVDPVYGTKAVTWTPLATVWANVRDMIPSRGERLADGVEIANRPCRVRMRYRSDVTSAMRLEYQGRQLRIITQPAELGRRDGLELIAEELTTEGQEP